MGKIIKILRKSIHVFLLHYNSLASIATILVFPFSASLLFSVMVAPSLLPAFRILYSGIELLFRVAGFPAGLPFFAFLKFKISQTIFSFAATLAFSLTSLLFAKAVVILIVGEFPRRRLSPPPFSLVLKIYGFLLRTSVFNWFVVLSANAASLFVITLIFNAFHALRIASGNALLVLSAGSAVLYSIVLANTTAACNLSIVVAAMESCAGHLPIIRARALIRGREVAAMALALPANLGMVAVEALFQFRVVKSWKEGTRSFGTSAIGEIFLIAYMHSILVVIDAIISSMLYKSCRKKIRAGGWIDSHLDLGIEKRVILEA